MRLSLGMSTPEIRAMALSLPLFVLRVFANHHHAPVPADNLALVAAWLNGCSNFHRVPLMARRAGLLEAVGDPSAGQVVGRELYKDAVSRKEFDELDADIRADVREYLVTVGQL